eukprot:8798451-Pyramimonas_sp.AAC.1
MGSRFSGDAGNHYRAYHHTISGEPPARVSKTTMTIAPSTSNSRTAHPTPPRPSSSSGVRQPLTAPPPLALPACFSASA